MTFEDFLLVQSEAVLGAKDQDLVVHGLAGQPLACRDQTRNGKCEAEVGSTCDCTAGRETQGANDAV